MTLLQLSRCISRVTSHLTFRVKWKEYDINKWINDAYLTRAVKSGNGGSTFRPRRIPADSPWARSDDAGPSPVDTASKRCRNGAASLRPLRCEETASMEGGKGKRGKEAARSAQSVGQEAGWTIPFLAKRGYLATLYAVVIRSFQSHFEQIDCWIANKMCITCQAKVPWTS